VHPFKENEEKSPKGGKDPGETPGGLLAVGSEPGSGVTETLTTGPVYWYAGAFSSLAAAG